MKLQTAETIIPRIAAVTSISRRQDDQWKIIGWSSRCECGSREDHLYQIDGLIRAHAKAVNHSINHKCRNNTAWPGHLSVRA